MKGFILLAAALLMAAGTHAQERSAGQAYDAQTNWASLKGMFDKVDAQNKILASMLDKMSACNTKEMLFVGTDKPGADGDGCKAPGISGTIVTNAAKEMTVTSPEHTGWVSKECPNGYVMTGGYWSASDQWAMHCRPLVIK